MENEWADGAWLKRDNKIRDVSSNGSRKVQPREIFKRFEAARLAALYYPGNRARTAIESPSRSESTSILHPAKGHGHTLTRPRE